MIELFFRTKFLLTLYSVAFLCSQGVSQPYTKDFLYVGTFSERESEGIYVLEFNRTNQSIITLQTITEKASPTFLELHPTKKYLYAAFRGEPGTDGTLVAYSIDQASGKLTKLNEQSTAGKNPCHVNVDPGGKLVYVSNYASGNLVTYTVNADGSLMIAQVIQHTGSSINLERQKEPHTHSTTTSPNGDFVYTSDLGIDKIMVYKKDNNRNLQPAKKPFIKTPPGSGPRHSTVHPTGKFLYSVEELTSTVAAYKVDSKDGSLHLVERVTTLSKDTTAEGNTGADIHISPDGKFLYASNRGQDNLAIYRVNQANGKLTCVGHEPTRGKHPRNFNIDTRGEFMFVANRYSDGLTLFTLDKTTGKLIFTGNKIHIPGIVCIKQLTQD